MLCRIFVSCSKLALEKVPVIRQELANHVTEALNHAPSVVIFDDLDSIISTPDSEGSQLLMSVAGLTDFLIDIMDEYRVRSMPFLLFTAYSLKCYVYYCSLYKLHVKILMRILAC